MRIIGMIGGMSWESSIEYYRLSNQEVRHRLGGHHNARSIMVTVDFAQVEAMQREGDWEGAGRLLAQAAAALERAGADLVLLCTNTMHKVAGAVQEAITVPFVHLADATAQRVADAGIDTVGLLGTRYTMEQDFYAERLRRHGLQVLVPGEPDRTVVHEVIYRELTQGRVEDASRREYRRVISDLADRGAGGVILGCTEIMLLVGPEDSPVPIFDSTRIHVERAVDLALA
jgi:aspartate racemase